MFRFVVVSAIVAAAHCGHIGAYGGSSKSYRKQDDFGHYEFGYDIKDGHGNINGRQEKGSHGHVVGSYYLGEIDGRHRTVEYVADKLGFRATIKTNEHGTKTSEPAFAPFTSDFGKSIPSGSVRVAGHHGHHDVHYGGQEQALAGHEAVTHEAHPYEQDHPEASYGHQQVAEPVHEQHSHPEASYGHQQAAEPVHGHHEVSHGHQQAAGPVHGHHEVSYGHQQVAEPVHEQHGHHEVAYGHQQVAEPVHGHHEVSYGHQQAAEPIHEQHGHHEAYAESAPVSYTIQSLNYDDLANYGAGLNRGLKNMLFVRR